MASTSPAYTFCMIFILDTCFSYICIYILMFNTRNNFILMQPKVAERHFQDLTKRYGSIIAIDLVNQVRISHFFFSKPFSTSSDQGYIIKFHRMVSYLFPFPAIFRVGHNHFIRIMEFGGFLLPVPYLEISTHVTSFFNSMEVKLL